MAKTGKWMVIIEGDGPYDNSIPTVNYPDSAMKLVVQQLRTLQKNVRGRFFATDSHREEKGQ